MYKKELTRLKNKFKLYMALHPVEFEKMKEDTYNSYKHQITYCKNFCKMRRDNNTCGNKPTLMYDFKNNTCYNTKEKIPNTGTCIEWIKNV